MGEESNAGWRRAGWAASLIARRGSYSTSLSRKRRAGEIPDQLLLLEHPAVLTLGRQSDPSHVLATA